MKNMKNILLVIAVFLLTSLLPATASEYRLMTKDELKAKLGSTELVVIDARSRTQWERSQFKVPGAVWLSSAELDAWSEQIPKDKTLVVYCA